MDVANRAERLASLRSAAGSRGFRDRAEAGRMLAQRLAGYRGRPDAVVLALPRGGVPVAFEIAQALGLQLDILAVKKITIPGYEEMAVGATASDGIYLLDQELISRLGFSKEEIEKMAATAYQEVQRRESAFRNHRPAPRIEGQTVILVDDGLATGSSMQVAVAALRRKKPTRIVVAVPVASVEAAADIRRCADDVVCELTPDPFYAVGLWYDDFSQTSDAEVRDLLERAASRKTVQS